MYESNECILGEVSVSERMRVLEHALGSDSDLPLSRADATGSELHSLGSDMRGRYLKCSYEPILHQMTTHVTIIAVRASVILS
jgi:hypothetical protein